jgi:CubicO group peptidase (beta-lactamase class C family)
MALVACATPSPEPSFDAAAASEAIKERLVHHDVPGAYVAVIEDGEVTYSLSWGTETVGGSVPYTENSRGRLASASKVLSGLTFLSMAEDGLLDLTASLGDLDPEVPERFAALPVWRILNHTSGLPMIVIKPEFQNLSEADMLAFTSEDILRLIGDDPVDFAPGEGWHYQQSGYGLLAWALEKKTGRSFADLMREHVLDPAGMDDTAFGDPDTIAPAYTGENGGLKPQPGIFIRPLLAAGGMDTTGEDLIALVTALQEGKIVSRATLERELLKPEQLYRVGRDAEGEGYGLATTIARHGKVWSMGHSGGGGLADIRYAPDENVAIVVLTNRAGGTGIASEIAEILSQDIFGPPHRAPAD